MFSLNSDHKYYLYRLACDMRKSFDGLCGLVRTELGCDPCNGSVYVFLNRRRTHMKQKQVALYCIINALSKVVFSYLINEILRVFFSGQHWC